MATWASRENIYSACSQQRDKAALGAGLIKVHQMLMASRQRCLTTATAETSGRVARNGPTFSRFIALVPVKC